MDESIWGSLRPVKPAHVRPFLKWAGGKGQVFPSLRQYFPPLSEGQRYFEPFLGGGAVFFALAPSEAVLSDLNRGLIATFSAIKSAPDEVLSHLRRLAPPVSEAEYYRRREQFNDSLEDIRGATKPDRSTIAAMFVWLNHTCYNGLYRVNKQGRFNVPFGFYEKPFIFSEAQITAASKALRRARARLLAVDYERALAEARKGDLAYLDPPYDPVSSTARFTGYTPDGFDEKEQERLSRVVGELVDRGCRVVLSNSASPRIMELYKGFRTARILVPRAINSVGSKRTPVDEIVVIA